MEYIQCPHCKKKYGVNDKVRAAVGRTIACKGCGESFEIELFETPTASMPAVNQATTEKNQVKEAVEETSAPKSQHTQRRKRRRAQPTSEPATKKKFSPPMLLGFAIVILSSYVVYHDRSIDVGKPFVATETPTPSDYASTQSDLEYEQEAPTNKAKPSAYTEFSEACKDIAAQQWVMDYTMMHGMPDGSEYVHMLDESMQNTASIREKCNGSSTVQEILATATEGTPPQWLKKHVSRLITLDKKTPHF